VKFLLSLFILVLSFAVFMGVIIERDPGLVLFTYDDYFFQTSIWVFFCLYVLSFCLFYILIRFTRTFLLLRTSSRKWLFQRNQEIPHLNAMRSGLIAFLEGNYVIAIDYFEKISIADGLDGVNYLFAAKAAERIGAIDDREKFLKLANQGTGDISRVTPIVEAQMALDRGDPLLALNILDDYPATCYSEKIRLSSFLATKDWNSIFGKISLKVETEDYLEFQKKAALIAFENSGKNDPILKNVFDALDEVLRNDQEVVVAYFRGLTEKSNCEAPIANLLEDKWNEDLVFCYAYSKKDSLETKKIKLHDWEISYPSSPGLHFCKGALYEEMDNYEMAEQSYKKGKNLGSVLAGEKLIEIYVKNGNLKKARGEILEKQ